MVRASALYIVIVIALVMAVICSSLIAAAYFYKLHYQKSFRYHNLQNNLTSGTNVLLESPEEFDNEVKLSLFQQPNDTVLLKRTPWGIYTIGTAKAINQQDTLSRAFSIASVIDSAKWCTLYLIDEDRPVSVSGKTSIKGNAYLPKAGLKEAYVNNQAYQGDKRLIIGQKRDSEKELPKLDLQTLKQQADAYQNWNRQDSILLRQDTVRQSFLRQTLMFKFGKQPYTLTNCLEGNIILHSDTSITIENTAALKNILVFARSITVKAGFKGNCQLYASDSIQVEADCVFRYPSVIGVANFADKAEGQRKLSLGDHTAFQGILFTYEKAKNELRPYLELGKDATVSGLVYSQGILNYKDNTVINGSVYTSRFLYQTTYTRYENYLINIKLDGPGLSPYYLTGSALPAAAKSQKILQWLP